MITGAKFSEDKKHRYSLWRIWDDAKPLVMFIGLNPSKAGEQSNDATIRKVIGYGMRWGYGGIYMVNTSSYISTKPQEIIYGNVEQNNDELVRVSNLCKDRVFAWGNFKGIDVKFMCKLFPNALCIDKNKNGSPVHPSRHPYTTNPIKFINN